MRLLTEWRGVIFGEDLILGSVWIEEQEVIEVADAVSQRANGKVFGCVGHEVPDHSLTWRNTAAVTIQSRVSRTFYFHFTFTTFITKM